MTLEHWLARIEQLHPSDIELGLDRVARVARALGVSSLGCAVITVAGTNGKGSCTALLDGLARAAGRRVALYTSPHLHRFNERIRIDGADVSDGQLVSAFEAVERARADTPLTYFEFTTLAALRLIADAGVDLAVLEVGLGGRLDAVNVVDADVAVVTSIGLDHTDWLGDTREAICAEKMGVGRPGRPLLFADPDPPANRDALARTLNLDLRVVPTHFGVVDGQLHWQREGRRQRLRLDTPVPLGADNLATALQALSLLDACPGDSEIARVAAGCQLAGRNQQLQRHGITWVFDVGHNREALWRFRKQLTVASGTTVALCGMLADKPAAQALAAFTDCVDSWHLCTLQGARGQSAEQLRGALPAKCAVTCHENAPAAVAAVLQVRPSRVLVFGSFLLLDAVAQALALDLFQPHTDVTDDSGAPRGDNSAGGGSTGRPLPRRDS